MATFGMIHWLVAVVRVLTCESLLAYMSQLTAIITHLLTAIIIHRSQLRFVCFLCVRFERQRQPPELVSAVGP